MNAHVSEEQIDPVSYEAWQALRSLQQLSEIDHLQPNRLDPEVLADIGKVVNMGADILQRHGELP